MYDFRDKIKELRVRKGLSQKELVKLTGITQASISQIETKKVMPYGITIKKLSKALNFDFEGILPASVAANNARLMIQFEEIEALLQEKDYQLAYQKINENILIEELTNLSIQKRYYYYLGLINVRGYQEYGVGLFHYMQVICMQKRSLFIEMFDIEALYETAFAYQQMHKFDKASYFYEEALLLVGEVKELERWDQLKIIEINYYWAQNELRLKNDLTALDLLEKVIQLSLNYDSSLFLGQANLDIAELYYQQNNPDQASDYLATAKAIGHAYQNEKILQKVALLSQSEISEF
ncbi:helix-turn-helix domain-containing protein [Carnobacterium gallinarum]|uniref:helix-turn-helix domain-containing protein n=1 Tax=Carnobacterium gallinarum TaxID=2749 RepID=UPI00055773BC|nr:helix-turn-helix transcriptional regulator [Carnobacterium gallinarum]